MITKKFRKVARVLIVAVSFIIAFTLLILSNIPANYDFREDEISTVDIFAPRDIVDNVTTDRQRKAAIEQVKPTYKIDFDINKATEKKLDEFFAFIRTTAQGNTSFEGKFNMVKVEAERNKISFSDSEITKLLSMSDEAFAKWSKDVSDIHQNIMNEGIVNIEATDAAVTTETETIPEMAEAAKKLIVSFLQVNKEVDAEATGKEIERVKEEIKPTTYKKNQIIVSKGLPVKIEQIKMLEELGMTSKTAVVNQKFAIGAFLFLIMCYGLFYTYVKLKKVNDFKSTNKLLVANLIPILMLIMIFFVGRFENANYILLPIGIGAILLGMFVNTTFSILCHAAISAAAVTMLGLDVMHFAAFSFTGIFATFMFNKARSFGGFAGLALVYSGLNMAIYTTFALIGGQSGQEIIGIALLALASGAISSVVAIGTTPFFEQAFNLITPIKLNDLASPEKKLLRQMLFDAPGTYHHSLMVGNLAEVACEACGANALLARVGAYYHDIGKLKRPMYFKENQMSENPHDGLMPEESANILISHIPNGRDLAKQYRLPQAIIDILCQHQGTTMTQIFYNKAIAQYGKENVNPNDYRYKGPKPQTKESAIVMLADSCEAAVRSLDNKEEDKIRAMVNKIISEKIMDDQLAECDLTFADVEKIKTAFIAMFCGYFHKRIKYSENPV